MYDSCSQEFKKALKEFDAKNYETVLKMCDKMIAKNSKDAQALALKGLNLYYLKKPKEGEQSLKEALKANMKSVIAWHFFAVFHKENANYAQALKSYNRAVSYAPSSSASTLLRDLSYLQLYLREFDSYTETCRICVQNKPEILANWVSLAFAYALNKNYRSALNVLDSVIKSGKDDLKKKEFHEIRIFYAFLLSKDGKYEEAMNYLIHHKNELIDKPMVYDMIIQIALKAKKFNIGLDYCEKALSINPDNIDLIIKYFIININQNDFNPKTYNDLLTIPENYKYLENMKKILTVLKTDYPGSKILDNLDLSFAQNEEFETKFENYFINQVKITIPSFYINIKYIYKLQPHKIKIIQKVLDKYLDNIKTNSKVNDNLDLPIHKSWVYFYAAQHYLFLTELETAIDYINLATDLTPSVIEFYMVMAKIFKHSYMRNHCNEAFDKARRLDVGDRYLFSKMIKYYLRSGNMEKHSELIDNYIGNPLIEESIKYNEPFWYLNECGCAYLTRRNILQSHYCFQSIINAIFNIIKDKDLTSFYTFCIKNCRLNNLYNTIIFYDGITKNKYLFDALIKLDLIYNFLKSNENNKELEEKFTKEFEKMKKDYELQEYEFKTISELIKRIEKDFYEVLIKLQKISNNNEIHYLCVKYFLKKEKLLMALKSMKILEKNKDTFFYVHSVNLIKAYLEEKKDKLKGKEILVDLAKEYIKDENQKIEFNEDNKLTNLRLKLYQKNMYNNSKENKDIIFEFIHSYDKNALRKMSGEEINNLIVFTTLFTDEDGSKEIRNELNKEMRLYNIDKVKVKRNMNFYEKQKFNKLNIHQFIKK